MQKAYQRTNQELSENKQIQAESIRLRKANMELERELENIHEESSQKQKKIEERITDMLGKFALMRHVLETSEIRYQETAEKLKSCEEQLSQKQKNIENLKKDSENFKSQKTQSESLITQLTAKVQFLTQEVERQKKIEHTVALRKELFLAKEENKRNVVAFEKKIEDIEETNRNEIKKKLQ